MDGVGDCTLVAGGICMEFSLSVLTVTLGGGVSYSPLSYLDGWPLMEAKFPLGFLNAAFKAFSKTGPTLPS